MQAAKSSRRWVWYPIIALLLVLGVGGALYVAGGALYHGPGTLPRVLAVMPGVPLFPMARVAPENALAQRLLALPLALARRHGAARAETVLLRAPGDHDFIVDWYRRMAVGEHWKLVGLDALGGRTRLIFARGSEGWQVLVGASDGLGAPVQYLYFDGMNAGQVRELLAAAPLPVIPPRPPLVYPKVYIAKAHLPSNLIPAATPAGPQIAVAPGTPATPSGTTTIPPVPPSGTTTPPSPPKPRPAHKPRPKPQVVPPQPVSIPAVKPLHPAPVTEPRHVAPPPLPTPPPEHAPIYPKVWTPKTRTPDTDSAGQ